MALAGHGVAGLIDAMAEAHLRNGELVPILAEWHLPPLPVHAVFAGRKLVPLRVRVFIDAMRTFLQTKSGASPIEKVMTLRPKLN